MYMWLSRSKKMALKEACAKVVELVLCAADLAALVSFTRSIQARLVAAACLGVLLVRGVAIGAAARICG